MSRFRNWCFTINNWTQSDVFAVDMLMKQKATYGCYSEEFSVEINKDTGKPTPHLQCFVHLGNALSFAYMKKALIRSHLVVANGTPQENRIYCGGEDYVKDGKIKLKNETFKEYGVLPEGQGKRTDLKEIAQLIRSHEITIEDIMIEYPDMYLRYSRSFEKMFSAFQTPRQEAPKVYWRWGLAGVGKTRYVVDTYGQENIYIKDNTQWWDGYNNQETILIDDFDNSIPFRTLLRILDRYAYQGQVKGGYVHINSPNIYITCEFQPNTYWTGNELAQVLRRLTSVEQIKNNKDVCYNAVYP